MDPAKLEEVLRAHAEASVVRGGRPQPSMPSFLTARTENPGVFDVLWV